MATGAPTMPMPTGPPRFCAWPRPAPKRILGTHVEFYEAMLWLQARRIRQLYGLVEDLNTLPLRARLAKTLLHLVRSYGIPCLENGKEVRIGLQLAQEELAQLLGSFAPARVNQSSKPWSASKPSGSSPVVWSCAIALRCWALPGPRRSPHKLALGRGAWVLQVSNP